MTEAERFELIWQHYHKQIDENRAVSRSLEALREEIQTIKDDLEKLRWESGYD